MKLWAVLEEYADAKIELETATKAMVEADKRKDIAYERLGGAERLLQQFVIQVGHRICYRDGNRTLIINPSKSGMSSPRAMVEVIPDVDRELELKEDIES